VTLPVGDYEATLTDPQLQILFVSHRRSCNTPQHCEPSTMDTETVAFRVTGTIPLPPPTLNRFNYLPHSHTVDDIYTDNTARAFVGRGGAAALTTMHCHDIYMRRRPRTWVRPSWPLCLSLGSHRTKTQIQHNVCDSCLLHSCKWSASKSCFLAADGHRVAQTPCGDIYRLLSLGQGVQFCTRERVHSSLHAAPPECEHVKEIHSMGLSDAGGSARIASRP
jgi:hypothetical protein